MSHAGVAVPAAALTGKLSGCLADRRTPRDENVWVVRAMVTLHLEIILYAVRVVDPYLAYLIHTGVMPEVSRRLDVALSTAERVGRRNDPAQWPEDERDSQSPRVAG